MVCEGCSSSLESYVPSDESLVSAPYRVEEILYSIEFTFNCILYTGLNSPD